MAGRLVVFGAVVAGCGRVAFDAGTTDAVTADAAPSCEVCASLVSAYAFDDLANLGMDSSGANHMVDMVSGAPAQSTDVPVGSTGHSLLLDGASTMCIASGFTFEPTKNHTLCWWAKPTALSDTTNQFAQFCQYDTWTSGAGTSYRWTINNCNGGTTVHFDVPNVYQVGAWVHICQTYDSATLTRTVMIVGDQGSTTYSTVDSVPIGTTNERWCLGSYGGGGFWTGLLHRPMWFNRILSETEIRAIHVDPCCFP